MPAALIFSHLYQIKFGPQKKTYVALLSFRSTYSKLNNPQIPCESGRRESRRPLYHHNVHKGSFIVEKRPKEKTPC